MWFKVQLIRIQLRVPEYGWTTQKVFHFLNFVVNGGLYLIINFLLLLLSWINFVYYYYYYYWVQFLFYSSIINFRVSSGDPKVEAGGFFFFFS